MAGIAAVEVIDDAVGVAGLKLGVGKAGGAAETRVRHPKGGRQQQKPTTAKTASRKLTAGC